MRLLVLAGGFGTRLKGTVLNVPKALAPVGDLPFLQLQIQHWITQGIRTFTFLLHHQAEQIIVFLEAQKNNLLRECQVDWIIESVPLDTGGAIANAVNELGLDGDFLMANADTWLGAGARHFLKARSPSMAVVKLVDVGRYGKVYFDAENRVTSFEEKNSKSEPGWINAGFYCLGSEIFKKWDETPFSLERDLFDILVKDKSLKAIPLDADFIDIGVPEDYRRFCRWIEMDRRIPL